MLLRDCDLSRPRSPGNCVCVRRLLLTTIALISNVCAEAQRSAGGPAAADAPCMDLQGLQTAVREAAWQNSQQARDQPERVVILTMCDVYCLEQLFEMWMSAIRVAKGGDLAKHVIIVALGLPALHYCTQQQSHHPHHCVLDSACGAEQFDGHKHPSHHRPQSYMQSNVTLPSRSADVADEALSDTRQLLATHPQHPIAHPHSATMAFATHSYFLALQQKLMWAREVLKLNTSVLWLDLDILVYKALLPRLVSGAGLPSADVSIAGESCAPLYRQDQEATLFRKKAQFHQNGGLWLVRATPGGKGLMDVWAGENWRAIQDAVSKGRRPLLDQDILNKIIIHRTTKTQAIQVTPAGRYIVQTDSSGAAMTWERPLHVRAYKLSIQFYQNQNGGHCGCRPDWKPSLDLSGVLSTTEEGGDVLQCNVSQRWVDQWVTMHFNGLKGMHEKVKRMKRMLNASKLAAWP